MKNSILLSLNLSKRYKKNSNFMHCNNNKNLFQNK